MEIIIVFIVKKIGQVHIHMKIIINNVKNVNIKFIHILLELKILKDNIKNKLIEANMIHIDVKNVKNRMEIALKKHKIK